MIENTHLRTHILAGEVFSVSECVSMFVCVCVGWTLTDCQSDSDLGGCVEGVGSEVTSVL